MDIKKIAIGTVVGAIVLYGLGIVIWGMLFADFFAGNTGTATGVEREPMIFWAIILGTLFYGEFITLALESRGARSVVDGAKVGAVVGLMIWGTVDFIHFGIWNINNLTATIADIVLETIRAGIAGAIVALVLSKVGSSGSSAAPAAE